MNAVIPITTAFIGGQPTQAANARELHAFMQAGTAFKDWITRRIEDYGFEEGKDFCSFLSESSGGRPSKEYTITLDMAKELAMVERNEKGKQARQYFIECERRAKERVQHTEMSRLEILQLAMASEQARIEAQEQLALAAPKVEYVDRYVAADTGSMGVREVAKVLGAKMNAFTGFLLAHFMHRTTPHGPLTPNAEHIHNGRFQAKTGIAEHINSTHAYVHYKFTAKGVAWISGEWDKHQAKLAKEQETRHG